MSGMLFANFNQDYSCVSVGTRKGYSVTNCDPFGRVYTQNDGARGIVEMLFCTSLIALVGAPDTPSSSPRKLQIVNTKRQSMICELLFPSSILAVKLNRKTLVIVLETEIYVYDISNMRLLHVIETLPNPDAICALSPSADAPYLAYPAPLPSPSLADAATSTSSPAANASATGCGDVLLFSTRALVPANAVRAHRSPLAILALSANGGLLATASVKGTVIRVFATPSLDKLYEFRRGTRETRIYSLAFNGAGTLLAAGSERGTVHLWRVGKAPGEKDKDKQSSYDGSNGAESVDAADGPSDTSKALRRRSLNLTASLTRAAASYLPTSIAEMWEPVRDFAWLKLPQSVADTNNALGGERRCVVGLSGTTPHVTVISSDGYFYAYSIDLERGGECVLVKQYSLLESGEEAGM
ncbi:WD40 repeat-like protein [Mycena polygramma]|nr:WD40 repeat-like protein [Mycena polygramma]KAJ7666619.1 WD40 repeat-like protein [Mycena polygramma]